MIKTYKIGECAIGGIIRVSSIAKLKENQVPFNIEILDWDTKKIIQSHDAYSTEDLYDILMDCTTHYWADKITNHFTLKN